MRDETRKALGTVIEAALETISGFLLVVVLPVGLVVAVLELLGVIDVPG